MSFHIFHAYRKTRHRRLAKCPPISGTIWISVKRTNQHKQVTLPENNMFAENQSKKLVVEPTRLKHIFVQIGSSSAGGRNVKNVLNCVEPFVGSNDSWILFGAFFGQFSDAFSR